MTNAARKVLDEASKAKRESLFRMRGQLRQIEDQRCDLLKDLEQCEREIAEIESELSK